MCKPIFIFSLFLAPFFTYGQETALAEEILEVDVLDRELPPLDSLLSAAISYSPVLKAKEAEIGRNVAEVKVVKRDWSNRIYTDGGFTYANNYSVLTVASDGGGFESVALGSGNVFRAGVTARLSLFDFLGRNQLIEKAEAERLMSEFGYETSKQDLTAYITELYMQLKLAKRLVTVQTETYSTLSAQMQMAEKEFRQGETHVTELARLTEIKLKSEVGLEQAKANYENLYMQMEILVGKDLLSFY